MIKGLAEHSPHGDANFNFGAIAMMKPYGPYYPGSYHLAKGHAFAIAMEGAEVVGDVFRQYRDPVEAEKHLAEVLNNYAKQVEAAAMQVARATGWTYEGIDATPAPTRRSLDCSRNRGVSRCAVWLYRNRNGFRNYHARGSVHDGEAHRLFGADDPHHGRQPSGEALVRTDVYARFDSRVFGGVRRRRGYSSASRRHLGRPDRANPRRRCVACLSME